MQEDFGDIAMQPDLLALTALIEGARTGEADDSPQEIESRLDILARGKDDICALSAEIEDNSRCATSALQFVDVESQVVVYSKQPAANLRALAAQIEDRPAALEGGVVVNQDDLRAMTDSFRRRPEALSDDSRQDSICPASQNSLDRGDSEMF